MTEPSGPIGAALRAQTEREQRATAQPVRHTADTINDDELDALYREQERRQAEIAYLRRLGQDLQTNATKVIEEQALARHEAEQRAEQAEAALEQAELDAEQQERHFRTLSNERESYRQGWKYEQKRRATAEAAIARVRAFADRLDMLASASFGTPVSGVDKAVHHTADLIRAALDGPQ